MSNSIEGLGSSDAPDAIGEGAPSVGWHTAPPHAFDEPLIAVHGEPTEFDRDPTSAEYTVDKPPAVQPYVLVFEGDAFITGEWNVFDGRDQLGYARIAFTAFFHGPVSLNRR